MRLELQSASSECGLACLAVIADHFGQQTGLRELRARFPLSLKGVSLSRLIAIAGDLGFQCRALRLGLNDLSRLATPCILHWNLNHFVVLVEAGPRKVVIFDPATGRRELSYAEASEMFTGVALELAPGVDFKLQKAPPPISVRQLTGPVSGLWRSLGLIVGLSVALQVFVVVAPFFMQWVVDQVLVSSDRSLLAVLGVGFGIILLMQVGTSLLRGWSVIFLSSRLGMQWTGNVFAHLIRLPMDFFEKRHLGDVVSRMGAVQAIQRTLTTSFVEAFIDGLMAIVTLAMMLIYSWKLAIVTLLAVAVYAVIRASAFRPVRDGTEQQLEAGAKQQGHLLESIRGIQSLKVSGKEALRDGAYRNLMNETVNRDAYMAKLALGFNSAGQLVFGVERIAVIWIGAILALQNVFSVGMLIAYLMYKDQFATRVNALIDKWVEFRMLRLHGERLADIVMAMPEVVSGIEESLPETANLEVKNLSFRYADGEPWVLQDCSFAVGAGESVAIVGASGCGKTTLVKLMLGLLSPNAGCIEAGGRDIRKLGLSNFRGMAAVVMQDDQLFAGSIADNIAFSEEGLDFARIEEAAKLAAIHDEITAMPMGYHSLIGDMGTTLSGGQKQRVILARALYRNPRILFLDEATSHLDVECERLVNDAVRQLKLTKIIIAHRPETIASADRVLMMHDGKISRSYRPRTSPLTALTAAEAG